MGFEIFQEELAALLPRLRRFAWGLTGALDRADDLVQAACIRALEKSDQWQAGSRLDSWMFRIIRNLHIDDMRSEQSRGRQLQLIRGGAEEAATDRPEEAVSAAELRAAISKLPDPQQSALLLICLEGYSYKEAAAILEVPVGTVASRVQRAREALMTLTGEAATGARTTPQSGSRP